MVDETRVKAPVISVLIITYNQADTVGRAIESVLAQRCEVPFEIIIADDASIDGTRAVCERYALSHPDIVTLLPEAPHSGVVGNYFRAFAAARGEFVADCAGDDRWIGDGRMQRQYDVLWADDSVAVVHGDWVCVDAVTAECVQSDVSGRNADLRLPMMSGRMVLTALLQHRLPVAMHLSTAMFRADIVRRRMAADCDIVCNEQFGCEDLPVMAAVLSCGNVAYIDEPLLAYTVGGKSITSESDMEHAARFYLLTTVATVRLARYYGVPLALLREGLAEKMRFVLSQAYHLRDGDLRRQIHNTALREGIPTGRKYRMLRGVTRWKPLWTACEKLQRALKI